MGELFSFPHPVNEKAARVVAGVVVVTAVVILATGAYWLLIPLAYGFWARVLTGPTLSPLGWTAQNLIAPRLGDKKYVSGPPKRFAQGMGAAFATLVLLIIAAGLESIFAVCLGCKVFAALMRAGLIPDEICAECADVTLRWRRTGQLPS
jgi:hypothetical protein